MKQSGSSQKSKESKYFDALRNDNYDNTFQATGEWLRTANESLLNKKKSERNIIMKLKNYLSAHKLKLAYTLLMLAFVVAACNYPVSQEESAGDVLKWTLSKDNTEAVKKIESTDWFRSGEYNINEENVNGKVIVSYNLVIPKEDHSKASLYKTQLESIPGVTEVNLIPLNETVKRPVYSALLNGLFKIDINATNMSDTELEKEITTQLKNAGIDVMTVNFIGDKDGHRVMKINIPEEQLKKDGGFDMTIKDGGNVTKLKEVRNTNPGNPERFRGKSDDEIRKIIREEIGNPEIKDDEIQIIREGDKVKVKVNMKRKDFNEKNEVETETVK